MTPDIDKEKPINEPEILSNAADALLEESRTFEITVAHQNLLHKMHILKTKRTFVLKPLYYGTLIRMSKILMEIEKIQSKEGSDLLAEGIDHIAKHADKMVDAIAIAVVNRERKPSWILKRFIKNNLTTTEIFELLNIVAHQMRIMEYLRSIVLIKGLSQMEKLTTTKTANAPQDTETPGKQSDQ